MPINATSLTGAAGEYFVMFRLSQLGFIAGLAPQGAPNADIIVTDVEGSKSIAIQVKTRRPIGRDNGWHMSQKHEDLIEDNLFYCFVDLPQDNNASPVIYVIPSKTVAFVIKEWHKIWLSTPGRNGKKHNDTKMRRLLPDYSVTVKTNNPLAEEYISGWMDKYKENWSLLGLKN